MSHLKLTRYRLKVSEMGKWKIREPFSVVFLSDLHNVSYGEGNSRLLQEIRSQNPEAVFIAGDMLVDEKKPQMDAALALLDELTKQYPVYYANGNHEQRMKAWPEQYEESYDSYADKIKSFGVHLLENAGMRITLGRLPVTVWGYELPMSYYKRLRFPKLYPEQIEETLGRPDEDSFHILLAHNPTYFPAYAAWGADLTLSGHLHGGIVRLPLLGGVVSPQLRLFPKYTKGLYTENGKNMITSAGLGSHTIKLRINNPPELVVIDFI